MSDDVISGRHSSGSSFPLNPGERYKISHVNVHHPTGTDVTEGTGTLGVPGFLMRYSAHEIELGLKSDT